MIDGATRDGATIRTYRFDDLVDALNAEVPMDWRGFLRVRLQAHDDAHLYDGLTRGGFALVDTPSPTEAAREAEVEEGGLDLRRGLGLLIGRGGQVRRVAWGSQAFQAGLAPGATLTSVDGAPYSDDALRRGLGHDGFRLGFQQDGAARSASFPRPSTQTWPALRRTGVQTWLLDVLAPRTPAKL